MKYHTHKYQNHHLHVSLQDDWMYLPNRIRRPSLWGSLSSSALEPNPPPPPRIDSVQGQTTHKAVIYPCLLTYDSMMHTTCHTIS